jgi:hypothetical protein
VRPGRFSPSSPQDQVRNRVSRERRNPKSRLLGLRVADDDTEVDDAVVPLALRA